MLAAMSHTDYLNNTVWAALSASPVSGVGVFAIRDIPSGTIITDHTINNLDTLFTYQFTEAELLRLHPAIRGLVLDRTSFTTTSGFCFVSPNQDAVLRSFMNHSEVPNTNGVSTLRDIKCGEELTEHYFLLTPDMHPLSLQHYETARASKKGI